MLCERWKSQKSCAEARQVTRKRSQQPCLPYLPHIWRTKLETKTVAAILDRFAILDRLCDPLLRYSRFVDPKCDRPGGGQNPLCLYLYEIWNFSKRYFQNSFKNNSSRWYRRFPDPKCDHPGRAQNPPCLYGIWNFSSKSYFENNFKNNSSRWYWTRFLETRL